MKIFTQSVYILYTNCERTCAAASKYIFFYIEDCMASFWNILMLFKDRATEKILTTASEIY